MPARTRILITEVHVTVGKTLGVVAAALVVATGFWFFALRGPPPAPAVRAAQTQGTALLIPGYGGGTRQLDELSRELRVTGIRSEVVAIGDGEGDLRDYAGIVEARARQLVEAGQPAPDLVGYSAGGITARVADSDDPALFRRIVTLGTPHNGTTTADAGALIGQCPKTCEQLRTGSDLIEGLPPVAYPGDWLSVWSDTDEVIRPVDSAVLPEIADYRLQQACPAPVEHGAIPVDPQAVAVITAFLADSPLPALCLK